MTEQGPLNARAFANSADVGLNLVKRFGAFAEDERG